MAELDALRSRRGMARSALALTAELVGRVAREISDPGPVPDVTYHSAADYDAAVGSLLTEYRPPQFWVFAYGSLIWKPAFEFAESRRAVVRGWHRSFCLRQTRWRGTPEQPGLMMALDRGGSCTGVAYRLPPDGVEAQLHQLLRREMTV